LALYLILLLRLDANPIKDSNASPVPMSNIPGTSPNVESSPSVWDYAKCQ
jgi:hypothetical protein